jgi:ParB family chromosome partitioning protein
MSKEILKIIPIKDIVESPWQGRIIPQGGVDNDPAIEEIHDLSDNIKKNGLMQPIIVREAGNQYEIVDGHRRVIATKMAGFGNIKAIIKNYDEQQAQMFSIIGNLHRKNLNPIELALSFQKVLNNRLFTNNKELSRAIGKDETFVGDVLNTLKMDKRIIKDITRTNSIKDVRLLRLIRKIDDVDENQTSPKQWDLYKKVISEKLSRKQVQEIVLHQSLQGKKPNKEKPWQLKAGKTFIGLKFNTGKINSAKQQKILKLLEEKMQELIKEI